ncbi:hypothetical protein FJT64_007887 [Amphibalanus amphitrite]|uniref:C-type lectin domain-containing protein n=1 Tax=Amphibalanus amphitrite TaxID=1232801 RepID=A0A6A4VUK6_AMPAM|nr:hypothetical protein FJT64_007887 [Amphibalanus amphitrite]
MLSFEEVTPAGGLLSDPDVVQLEPGVGECECRARCLSDIACRGYGHSVSTSTCLLTELLPTPGRLNTSAGDWRWHARRGVRLLGEPCAADRDCSLLVPGATCFNSTCGCHGPVEEDGSGGCRKAGSFIAVGTGRLTGQPLWEQSGASVNACSAVCAANSTCLAFDLSSDGICTFYSEGITSDTGSGRDVQSFVWSFRRPDGKPPQSYTPVNGTFLSLLPPINGSEAAQACYAYSSILMPGVSPEQLEQRSQFLATQLVGAVWIGLEDMLEHGNYLSSDGTPIETIAWNSAIEPSSSTSGEACALVNPQGRILDNSCSLVRPPLCQFVGENLALNKPSWMNAHHPPAGPARGNDGNVFTIVHTPMPVVLPVATWTVDLGGPVQVTSVLYAARRRCCGWRNHLTEVRAGTHPTNFDEHHSALCVWLERPFMVETYARQFPCTTPLTGRYVRVIRHRPERVMDFADVSVFGNRLQMP